MCNSSTLIKARYWKATLIALCLLTPILLEIGHAVWIWRTMDDVALLVVRYGVSGEYDPAYCSAPCDSDVLQDSARLRSIYDVVQGELAKVFVDREASSSSLRVTVCSNRPGYQYDEQSHMCLPRNDAGTCGNEFVVSIGYDYPLGSLWGAGFAILPLRVTHKGIVERFRTVRIGGLPSVVNAGDSAASGSLLNGGERLVVVNGDVQLVVTEVDGSVDQITRLANEAGGYVIQSTLWYDGERRRADVKIRIPADKFNTVLEQVEALGTRVLQENISGQDVTEEHVDLEARLRSLQATVEQLTELLERAQTVDEALAVNTELGRLQEQIDQMLGRKQYLENQAALATLTVSLSLEPPRPVLVPTAWQPTVTFAKALRFLIATAYYVGDLLIWAGVVGLPLIVLGWGGIRGIQRWRRRKHV